MREKTTIIRAKNVLGLAGMASILAWTTYGTTAGVLGMIAYLAVGLLGVFPWIIPFAGIPLGLLDFVVIPGIGMYEVTLKIAHIEPSWLAALWYLIVVVVAGIAGLIFSGMLWNALFRKQPRPRNLALINCHIIDGRRDSSVIDDGVILVRNISEKGEKPGCIAAVGPAAEISVPEGYEKIDIGGQYVLPGFINAHCHLISSGKPTFLARIISENEYITDKLAALLTTLPGKYLFLKMMEKNTRNALHSGVTTIRTLGDLAWLDVKLRDMIDTNKILGPRMLVSGPIICPTGGHGSYMALTADSVGEFARAVRTNLHKQVDWIKIASTGGVMDARSIGEAGRPQMTVEEIETVCTHAHQGGFMVATHCESSMGIEDALTGGVDTIEHGAYIPENMVSLFKNNPKALRGYTVLVPTISAPMGLATLPMEVTKISEMSFKNSKIVGREMIKGLRRAYAEGIVLGVGTDASVPYVPHYEFWKEVAYMLHYTDMSPQLAIYMATLGNAQALEIAAETGSIEAGKSADLQVLPTNPLDNINVLANVSQVFIRGHLIDKPRVNRVKTLDKTPIPEILEVSDE